MIRTLYRHRSGTILADIDGEQLANAARDTQSRLWIDMQAPTAEEFDLILSQLFHFHPLSIEDTINEVHIPKIDNYGQYLYLVFHTFKLGDERMDIDTFEIDVFLGANYIITVHNHDSPTIEKMWNETYHQGHGLALSPARLLYEMLDIQVDLYIPLLDRFEMHVEELGDLIFQNDPRSDNEILEDILTAKSSALRLRRFLIPQREVLARLANNDYPVIPNETRIYFRDVYDHIMRLADLADSMRDLVNSTTTTHLTITNNRMNEIMKVLTVISTIFIPLSFLAGVYGMNFDYMPALHARWSYPVLWVVFGTIALGMLMYFRRKRWL